MSNVLLLTSARESPADILPSLSLLPHAIRTAPAAADQVASGPVPDAVLVDARRDLVLARRVLQSLRAAGTAIPVIAVVTDGGWAAVSADWGADDLLLHTAGPGEVEARLRLAIGRTSQATTQLPEIKPSIATGNTSSDASPAAGTARTSPRITRASSPAPCRVAVSPESSA